MATRFTFSDGNTVEVYQANDYTTMNGEYPCAIDEELRDVNEYAIAVNEYGLRTNASDMAYIIGEESIGGTKVSEICL